MGVQHTHLHVQPLARQRKADGPTATTGTQRGPELLIRGQSDGVCGDLFYFFFLKRGCGFGNDLLFNFYF